VSRNDELRDRYYAGLQGRKLQVLVEGRLPDRPDVLAGTACRYAMVELPARSPAGLMPARSTLVDVVADRVENGRVAPLTYTSEGCGHLVVYQLSCRAGAYTQICEWNPIAEDLMARAAHLLQIAGNVADGRIELRDGDRETVRSQLADLTEREQATQRRHRILHTVADFAKVRFVGDVRTPAIVTPDVLPSRPSRHPPPPPPPRGSAAPGGTRPPRGTAAAGTGKGGGARMARSAGRSGCDTSLSSFWIPFFSSP